MNHSWVLQFARSSAEGGSSWRLLPQILLYHIRNLAHKLGEDSIVLEIGCGAYAPFARWCAEAGAKQATLRESFKRDWLVVTGTMEFYVFPYIGNNHPNWRSPWFFRGVGIPPTRRTWELDYNSTWRFSPSRATAGQLHVLHLWLRTQCRLALVVVWSLNTLWWTNIAMENGHL